MHRYVAGNGFYILGAHTDSPCLKLKPVTKVILWILEKYYVSYMSENFIGNDLTFFLVLNAVMKVTKGGYLEVGVQTYGGGLWHTWFDRDLSLAGRVILKEEKDGIASYSHRLVRIEEPIMRIPTLAIHLDRCYCCFVYVGYFVAKCIMITIGT